MPNSSLRARPPPPRRGWLRRGATSSSRCYRTVEARRLLYGPEGFARALRPGSLFIDMGTDPPDQARELARSLAQFGVAALDAPVSGGERGAIAGTLSIMVGGAEAAFERAL